jgi:hypothetical protein
MSGVFQQMPGGGGGNRPMPSETKKSGTIYFKEKEEDDK